MPDSPRPNNSKVPAASDFSKVMTKIHQETEAALEEATGQMKAQYDKHKRPSKEYHVRDLKIHPHFNEKLLTPYVAPTFPNQEQPPPPPPDLIDNEEQWEIEEVLDSKPRKVRGKHGQPSTTVIDYFIKWKGWTCEHNSWVTEKEMGNAKEAIAEYVKKTKCNERVAIVKITTTPKSPLAMIINHHYSNDGDFLYLAQRKDGTQKWLLNPNVDKYKTFLEEYWANYYSAQETTQTEP
ncbi:uncharacterized protein ARMOST_16987 [Armillaria ostoyae]|uniref:Chromo domain-containing protein n=1 Tax=Armillaria ostoyae TaxID=47428 RepID=A0A284RXT2_ARMOS|nr:uncharacterized protein ARMOST_16987 [Armillaria ostoyae]